MNASFLFDVYRRQVEAMQNLTSASLSGFERAQQAALASYRQVVDRQLETVGRVSEQATSVAMDPEQVRPAMTGIMEAQRDLMSAMADTQRRCIEAIVPDADAQNAGTSAYLDTMRKSIDQWQRWTEQVLRTAREQTERVAGEMDRQSRELIQASGQAARGFANQQQDALKKTEETVASTRRQTERASERPTS